MPPFKIGDRVFFIGNSGIGVFGNVAQINNDDARLIIRADDMQLYDVIESNVVNLASQ